MIHMQDLNAATFKCRCVDLSLQRPIHEIPGQNYCCKGSRKKRMEKKKKERGMLLLLTSASSLLLATRLTIVMFSTPVLQNRDAAVIACFGSANARIADLTNITLRVRRKYIY